MDSVQANRFNVSKLVYAIVLKDDVSSYEHGPIKKLGEPMQVQLTPTYANGILYGGGVKTEDMSLLTGAELQIDANKVAIEVRADIYDHEYVNGILNENPADQPKDIAVGYEVDETGNNKEVVWLYKGRAKPMASNVQQKNDNINFATDVINIACVPRKFDKNIKAFGDTANPTFTKANADAFLDSIPGGTLIAGV